MNTETLPAQSKPKLLVVGEVNDRTQRVIDALKKLGKYEFVFKPAIPETIQGLKLNFVSLDEVATI